MKYSNSEITHLFNILPIGAALDLIRCIACYDKFKGTYCTKLNSAKSLKNRKLIHKNKNNTWVPTKESIICLKYIIT